MQNLHQRLTSKYPQYHNWHQTKHHNKIHWGVLVVFTLLVFVTISHWTSISFAADTVAPTTPTNLTATAISFSQINLSWTASTDDVGVTGYKIYRCAGSTCAPTVQIATSSTNSYSNTGLTASTAYTYAVSAYDAAGNEGGKSIQTSATTQVPSTNPIDNLSNNTWTYLNPQLSKRYKAIYQNPSATENQTLADMIETREPAFREYSSPVYGDNKIFYFGGGHSGYAGNDVEVYDIPNNIWNQSYKPNVPPADDPVYGSGGSPNAYVNPATGESRPYQIHGYSRTTYHPGIKQYVTTAWFCTNVSFSNTNNTYSCAQKAFSLLGFDPATRKWSALASSNVMDGADLSQWDSGLGGILIIKDQRIWLYKDGVITPRKSMSIGLSRSGGSASIYIPDEKVHLFALMPHGSGSGSLVKYDSLNETVENLTPTVPAELAAKFSGLGNFVMAYDRLNKKVVALTGEDNNEQTGNGKIWTWIYDVPANTWEKLPLSLTAPAGVGFGPLSREPFQYDPINNVFILVHRFNGQLQTWAYRYKKAPSTFDSIPPSTPTNLTATAISSSQINLSWSPSTDNVGVAGYRIYRDGTQISTVTQANYTDTDLTPSTMYSYTVAAYDTAGNISPQSTSVNAMTLDIPSDTISPSVSLTAPSSGATVSGTITVSATASDNVGVVDVQFKVDGMNLGAGDTTSPYSISWDTTTVADGPHTFTAVARDAAGNVTTATAVTVTVANAVLPPPGQINIPLKTWIARPLPKWGKGPCVYGAGCKHLRLIHNPVDGKIYQSGGDFGGPGDPGNASGRNEVYSYSIASDTWTREYPYCGPTGDVQPEGPDEVGWTYDTNRNIFWMIPGGMWGSIKDYCAAAPSATQITNEIMTFDPVAKKWDWPRRSMKPVYDASLNLRWAMYDPVKDEILLFHWHGGEGFGISVYNIKNNTWTRFSLATDINGVYLNNARTDHEYAAMDLKNRHIYIIPGNENRLLRYNMDDRTITYLTDTPVQPLSMFTHIVWDPVNEVLLWPYMDFYDAYIKSLYIYHPDTNTWEQDSMFQPDGLAVRGNNVVFDPYQNALMVMGGLKNGGDDPDLKHLFLYRYGNGSGGVPPDTQAPTVPANVQSTAVSSSQINLSWTASTDVGGSGLIGYKIYRCLGSTCTPTTQIATSATTSYSNTGLTASTAYTYVVSAYDNASSPNESAKSSSVSAATLAGFKPSDLNKDAKVDSLDFEIFKLDFNRTDKPVSDINQDGIVDSRDLGIMMSSWEN